MIAYWESREEYNDFLHVQCSNCGFWANNYEAVKIGRSSVDYVGVIYKYCPKCGREMKVHGLQEEDSLEFQIEKLMSAFPGSYIKNNKELIISGTNNVYLLLEGCDNPLDLKCKVLEWISRDASYSLPYKSEKRNRMFHDSMRSGINKFLGTDFTEEQMQDIYINLGNAIHHDRTIRFVENNYDFAVFESDT